jgi:hypothetical protein
MLKARVGLQESRISRDRAQLVGVLNLIYGLELEFKRQLLQPGS